MTTHPCLRCTDSFPSEKKLWVHMAIAHECDETNQSVPDAAIKSLEKCKDRVHYLLKKYPATRSSDQLLYLYYIRIWGGALVYNADLKLVEFRNKVGIPLEEWIHQPNYETCRRSRQSIQSKHPELKASERIQALREAKEAAYHRHFAEEMMGKRGTQS